ncbi:MAG: LysR family transcriptional regulator [Polyangiales bacterium]
MAVDAESLSWDDLRVFLAVLREGSFTRAAARLGVEQSTISRRVQSLETCVGRPLFNRDRRGPTPTDLGERLREHAERVESEVHALLDVAGKHERTIEGRVRLATTEALAVQVLIPTLLPKLRKKHPRLFVDLVTSDNVADLTAREADLALRFFRPTRGDLRAQKLATLPIAPIASKGYRAEKKKAAELDWIVYELSGRRAPELELFEKVIQTPPVLRTNGYVACVEAVRAGMGVSLLATAVCEWDRSLRVLPLDLGALPSLELWLVAPRTLRGVPRVDAVWNALIEHSASLSGARPAKKRARSAATERQ